MEYNAAIIWLTPNGRTGLCSMATARILCPRFQPSPVQCHDIDMMQCCAIDVHVHRLISKSVSSKHRTRHQCVNSLDIGCGHKQTKTQTSLTKPSAEIILTRRSWGPTSTQTYVELIQDFHLYHLYQSLWYILYLSRTESISEFVCFCKCIDFCSEEPAATPGWDPDATAMYSESLEQKASLKLGGTGCGMDAWRNYRHHHHHNCHHHHRHHHHHPNHNHHHALMTTADSEVSCDQWSGRLRLCQESPLWIGLSIDIYGDGNDGSGWLAMMAIIALVGWWWWQLL